MHVFFGANLYYLYGALKISGRRHKHKANFCRGKEFVKPITGMHMIHTDQTVKFDEYCSWPVSSLQNEFIKIEPTHHGYKQNGLRIAYEMCDSSKRDHILVMHRRLFEE